MTPEEAFKAALRDAEDESLETLEAGATLMDSWGIPPHVHQWKPTNGSSRLVGDVWQQPLQCPCGATAWSQNWAGKTYYVDVRAVAAADMTQDDPWGTYLPQGSLRWYGFDFDHVRLPYEPLMDDGESTAWIGNPPEFVHRRRVHDADLEVTTHGFECDDTREESLDVLPKAYLVNVRAQGMPKTATECADWTQVQQHCRQLAREIEETYDERHAPCQDADGRPTAASCITCQLP